MGWSSQAGQYHRLKWAIHIHELGLWVQLWIIFAFAICILVKLLVMQKQNFDPIIYFSKLHLEKN